MLLQKLLRYSERMTLPPTLYVEAPVRYIVDLTADGRYTGLIDTADLKDRKSRNGVLRQVPFVKGTSNVRALLLAQNSEYALGIGKPNAKPERVRECHQKFIDLAEECAQATQHPGVAAVVRFLTPEDKQHRLGLPDDFDPAANLTFRVDGSCPIDAASVRQFWAAKWDMEMQTAPIMQCVVCGERRPVLRTLKESLKRVPNGQTSGTAIISANSEAFESYGLERSLIAPCCADCGERFTKALNELLASERQCVRMGGAAFVYWTRDGDTEFDYLRLMTEPSPEQVHDLLDSVRSGGRAPVVDPDRFYGCSLSGSGGRAVVRDWIDTTVPEAKDRLAEWFSRQAITDPYGEPSLPLGIYALAAATVRDARKELAPPTPRALLRAALTGTPVAPSLLHATVRRCQVEQGVTRPRAALIKLALTFRHPYIAQEDTLTHLDEQSPSVAYRCGRLLAVLEQAQQQAIPGVNQTVVDRFYGTASSSPRSVFPRLVNGAQPHLGKLRRDRPGAAHALTRRLEDIMGGIPTFPAVLNLEQQGLFALGYYHQRAHDRTQAAEARARRLAGQSAGPEADLIPEDAITKEN